LSWLAIALAGQADDGQADPQAVLSTSLSGAAETRGGEFLSRGGVSRPRSYDRQVEVKLGKRQVENVTPVGPGPAVEVADNDTITVSVELGPPPDQEWIEIWKRGDFPMDLEEPVLHDRPWLLFTAEKKDIERAWRAIKARVEATNLAYAGSVIPAREAARRREQAKADVAAEALEDAQRLVDELE
jgi:hypothetical protein